MTFDNNASADQNIVMRILWVAVLVVVIDQITKVWIRSTMYMSQSIPVLGDWFRLTYTENPGMAFGITIGPKAFTTIFALLATILLVLALWRVRTGHFGYRLSLALILGGAIGNIIDRVFYGVIFGYGGLFQGRVVDFIHFDVWRGTVSIPFLGESYIALFPIWNVADMAIVTGAVAIMIFHNTFLDHPDNRTGPAAPPEPQSVPAPEQVRTTEIEEPSEPDVIAMENEQAPGRSERGT